MKILLDSADEEIIESYMKIYPLIGVTTNPTILSKDSKNPVETLLNIRKIIGHENQLHVQLTETEYDAMMSEAYKIVELLGENTFVKVPVSEIGIKVMKNLSKNGVNVTATAILTATQAMLSAETGAKYVAPYVSRLENIMGNGIETIADISQIFSNAGYSTEILAASFKTGKEVLDTALAGAENATVSPAILKMLSNHPISSSSIDGFDKDWKNAFGSSLSSLIDNYKN